MGTVCPHRRPTNRFGDAIPWLRGALAIVDVVGCRRVLTISEPLSCCSGDMTTQRFAQYAVGDQAAAARLWQAFEEAGYRVKSASTPVADIAVRYRTGSGDEADMALLVSAHAPGAERVRDRTVKLDIPEYRAATG